MRLLAVEPYYGGSHRAFLDGWRSHSRHTWDLLTLPAHHWKWRMRLGAVTLAEQARALVSRGQSYDVVVCSSMLDVACWRSLAPVAMAQVPHMLYFHENQWAYPTQRGDARDVHFGLTQLTSALAVVQSCRVRTTPIWWNSAYNRDTFFAGLADLLSKMPGESPTHALSALQTSSCLHPPGFEVSRATPPRTFDPAAGKPMRLVWAGRWEHDKRPELFFTTVRTLIERGIDVRLSVLGERFNLVPAAFGQARELFASRLVHFGYLPDRSAYEDALCEADVFVSTAAHEFFGIAAVEAAAAGCTCVLPRKLAYPEVFGRCAVYYDTDQDLVEELATLKPLDARDHVKQYAWPQRAAIMDTAVATIGN